MKGRFAPHILEKQMRFLSCVVIVVVPFAVAVSITLLLALSSQVHEVLLRAFEGTLARDIAGLVVFTLLCMLLGTWDYHLSSSIKDAEYSQHANPYLDRLLGRFIAGKALFVTALPFVGLMFGFHRAWNLQTFHDLGALLRPDLAAFKEQVVRDASADHYNYVFAATLGMLALSVVLIAIVHRRRIRLLLGLVTATVALGSITILVAWFAPELLTNIASYAGSFSVLSLVTMGVVTLFFGITFTARNSISAVAVLISLVIIGVTWGVTRGAESSAEAVPVPAASARPTGGAVPVGKDEIPDLEAAFKAWVVSRKFGTAIRSDPVFILALPGGGIAAGSAGATMLAVLQDRCPAFARHIFAISAVSGGAVGATIFNTVLAAQPQSPPAPCDMVATRGEQRHQSLVRSAILPDHLAPVGAFLLPDVLRKIPGLVGLPSLGAGFDRAQALEISVRKALRALATRPGGIVVPDALVEQQYLVHWTPEGHVPALLLNTTWVETGGRVAFAPFKLKDVGGGNLYAFADDLFQHSNRARQTKTLQAGVVSARFPGTSPAWQLDDVRVPAVDKKTRQRQEETRTWNFVDGGYADNSGMLTAFDVYKKLAALIDREKLAIDLRLVAIGDDPLEELPKGTSFTDTVAPVSALLNLRRRGLVEVVREITGIDPYDLDKADELNTLLSARAGVASKLLVFRLNREEFPLTLGWTISRFRNSTIRLQLGEPELCITGGVQEKTAADIIVANSCVQREILGLVGARWPQPARGGAPRPAGGG
jgi:hypothetical protein